MAAPLTAEDKRRIDEALKDLATAKDIVRRGEQAGLDMTAQKAEIAELEKSLTGLRGAFFPTGSAT